MTQKPKAKPMLKKPTRIHSAAHYRREFLVPVPAGQTAEDLLAPEYWSHVASSITPGDTIEAQPEDGSWFAKYLVRSTSKTWAKLALLQFVDLGVVVEEVDDPDYHIKWGGVGTFHQIIRKSDDVVVKSGIKARADAVKWLKSHVAGIDA